MLLLQPQQQRPHIRVFFFLFTLHLPKIIYHINSLTLDIFISDKITLHTILYNPLNYFVYNECVLVVADV